MILLIPVLLLFIALFLLGVLGLLIQELNIYGLIFFAGLWLYYHYNVRKKKAWRPPTRSARPWKPSRLRTIIRYVRLPDPGPQDVPSRLYRVRVRRSSSSAGG